MKHNLNQLLKMLRIAYQNSDYSECLRYCEEWNGEFRHYIDFVDKASRTHGLVEGEPIQIKYKIYKEILGESETK